MIRPLFVFLICLATSLVFFIPAIGAGFVYDFLGWQKEYENGSFADILNCFGYNGHHQFLHLVFYSFYKIFYIQGLPWYLFFCTLHAINGYLLYRVIVSISKLWKFAIAPILIIMGVLFFMLHPYVVEAVVWRVCAHYLISLMASLGILLLFIRYLESGMRNLLIIAGVVFLISLFTLEISFVTPMVVVFAGIVTWLISFEKKKVFRRVSGFSGVLFGLLGMYLLLNKFTLGTLVGHYGGDVHLKFDLLGMVSTELKHFVKHIFYARFYSFKTKAVLFDQVLSLPEVAFFVMSAFIAIVLFYFLRIKKVKPQWHLIFFGITCSLLFILPVANIFFYHLHIGMNDRYSYFPIAFLSMALIAGLSLVKKEAAYGILGVLLVLNIFLQQKTLRYWKDSTTILQSLKEDFRWHDAPYVFVLNSPDNYKGIVMASIIEEPSGIDELIDYQTPRAYNGKMFDVFQYNLGAVTDGVKVEQTGPLQIKVMFNQWGNWWHRNGIGGGTYENEYYKAETLDFPYILTFKQFPPGSVIIYQVGHRWEEFKFQPM